MLYEEMKKMSKLSDRERSQLQIIQEGLTGVKPIDDAWTVSTIKTLKSNPDIIKSMFKGKGAMIGK